MRRIVMTGIVVLAAVLGGAIPAAAATTTAGAAIVSTAYYFGNRISCGSPTACLTVGAHFSSTANPTPSADALSGKKWRSVSVRLPKGATSAALGDVSCKTATYCLVVGTYSTKADPVLPYALTWNGTALTPVAAPPVPNGSLLALDAVSCTAVKSCVAVGTSISPGISATGDEAFTDTWNGRKWTEAKTAVKGTSLDEFTALHCFSTKSCVAAGDAYSDTGAGTGTVLVARWNGKTWTPEKAVTPAGYTLLVTDLSCVSATSCALAGASMNEASTSGFGFLEVLKGKTWSEFKWTGAKGDRLAFALGVSCVSAGDCVAVGEAGTSKSGAAAALSWNGKKWTALKVPAPAKGDSSTFSGVSCPKSGDCIASGEAGKTSTAKTSPIAGYWNGKAWKIAAA